MSANYADQEGHNLRAVMKLSRAKSWMRLVLCYWVFMLVIVYLEMRYMASGWAGLPGFLFTLPLSVFVVTAYFLASYATEFQGYNIHVTECHTEYGFLICAFLNGFVFYPVYCWWLGRNQPRVSEPPSPPTFDLNI